MTSTGVFNPNWRGKEMREYLNGIRSDGKKLVELGSCGHELKSRPLWMVGKSQLCFSCWEAEVAEQKRIMENITEEAQAEYFYPAWQREAEAQAADFADLKRTEDDARF